MFLPVPWVAEASANTITVKISHLWNGEALEISGKNYPTGADESLQISRLAYLLTGLVLTTDEGQMLSKKGWFYFIDAANQESKIVLRKIPDAGISRLDFQLGLDRKTDQAPIDGYPPGHALNPLVNGLHWSPQGGFIFLALEGRESNDRAFSYHYGHHRNQVAVSLPLDLDLKLESQRHATVQLNFHLDRLFDTDPPLRTLAQNSTHSREGDPLVAIFKSRLAKAFSIDEITYDDTARSEEKLAPNSERSLVGTPYEFRMRKGFPFPQLPSDFPLTNERVELGRRLFHDARLSRTNQVSCASCHHEDRAFTDGERFSTGVDQRVGKRNSMPLVNLAWKSDFFWDGRSTSLREQALVPIEDHLEMDESLENVVGKIADYAAGFENAFGDKTITAERIGIAIEQFVLTLTSFDSKFDRAAAGTAQLTDEEKRGFELFMTEYDPRRDLYGADCFHCHGGAFFTDHRFRNNGLQPLGPDLGLSIATGKKADQFKFATPSLRNVALTAPYMHDGRFATLDEVVEHYVSGIHPSPTLDPNIGKHGGSGIPISEKDQAALVAFLKTLTDPRFVDPKR